MQAAFSRSIFGEPNKLTSLQKVRERILKGLLISTIIIEIVLFTIFLLTVFKNGLKSITFVYATLLVLPIIVLLFPRIPYLVRTCCWVFILYALGTTYLIMNGLNVIVGLFFLGFVAMTSVLLSLRSGLIALLTSCITIAFIGFLSIKGMVSPQTELLHSDPLYWIGGGVVFLLMGILMSTPLASLIRNLDIGLIKATSLAKELELTSAALRANEERFRAMIEDSSDIISILNIDGTIQYISPSVEGILGYKPNELIEQKIFDYLHPEDVHLAVAAMTPGIPPEEIGPSLELRARHKDGSWRILEVKGKEMHTHPAVHGTIINCRDITKRKEVEKALQRSTQLVTMVFASLSDAVFVLDDKTTTIVDCNPAALNIFGYRRDEMVGRTPDFLYSGPGAREEFRKRLFSDVAEKGFLNHFEFRFETQGWYHHSHRT